MKSKSELTVQTDNVENVLKEIQNAFYDIPFENSEFQTEHFVLAAQITPERAYRALGLRMYKKLIAVQESIIDMEKSKIEEEQMLQTLEDPTVSNFEKRKIKLDLKLKEINRPFFEKLLNDAIVELNVLYKHFKVLPKYTRQEFELGEKRHFLETSKRALMGISSHSESLFNIEHDINSLLNFEKEFATLPASKRHLLQDLTEKTMTNYLQDLNIPADVLRIDNKRSK
jgi:hypothetical protein